MSTTYYCGNQNFNSPPTTLEPSCILKSQNLCLHLPSSVADVKLIVKPLEEVWKSEVLPKLEKLTSASTVKDIETALLPLAVIILQNYSLGDASTTNPDGKLKPMTNAPNCVKGMESGALSIVYEVLKSVLPLIAPWVDVSNLPMSLLNNTLNACPQNPDVYIVTTPDTEKNWKDKCTGAAASSNTQTVVFIIVTVVLLILVAVFIGLYANLKHQTAKF